LTAIKTIKFLYSHCEN